MSEIKENEEKSTRNPTWKDIHNMYTNVFIEQKESVQAREKIASEIIAESEKKINTLDMWIKCMIGLISVIVIVMSVFNYKNNNQWRKTVREINEEWIDYLSQYDFVVQDGSGVNYYNSDVGGNVNNGSTSPETEK